MKRYGISLSGLLIAGTLCAADAPGPRMSSPVLGYVFDNSAQAIRSISGVPGAASLGAAVALPALTSASVHSSGADAIVVTKEGKIAYASWAPEARLQVLDTALGSLTSVAFAAGRFAISNGSLIEVWSTEPALVSRYRSDAAIGTLAISREGTVVAGTASGLMRFSDRGSETVAPGADWSAVAFAGSNIVAADATYHEFVLIDSVGATNTAGQYVDSEGGRSTIAALPGRVRAIVASGNGESFLAALADGLLAISSAGATPVACGCEPQGLDPLQGSLTAFVRGTQFLLDASGVEPQLTRLPSLYAVNVGGAN